MRISIAIMAGLAAITSAFGAKAADLYGGLTDVYGHPGLDRQLGWYARIDGGYSISADSGLNESGFGSLSGSALDDTAVLGGGLGMYLGRNLRVDFTGDYRFGADVSGVNGGVLLPGERRFKLDSAILLANLYYDFDIGRGWRPYVGAGVGAVHHDVSSGTIAGGGSVDSDSSWNFAGALMAGFSVNFGARSMPGGSAKDPIIYQEARGPYNLDFGYRFLYLGDARTGAVRDGLGDVVYSGIDVEDVMAHEFRIGLRVDLR